MYNKKHDKFYIGQTYSLKKRINDHKTGLVIVKVCITNKILLQYRCVVRIKTS